MDAPSEAKCYTVKDLIVRVRMARADITQDRSTLYKIIYLCYNKEGKILCSANSWVGILLTLITLAFIIHRAYLNWALIKPAFIQIKVITALESMGILSIAIMLLGWNWISVLQRRGMNINRLDCIRIYFLANLTRYVPGGIWHFAGRTLWLLSQGYRFQSVLESLIFEQGLTLVASIAVGFGALAIIERAMFLVGIASFSVFLLVVLAAFVAAGSKTVRSSLNLRSIRKGLILVVSYILFWVLYGLAISCLAMAILAGGRLTLLSCIRLTGQAALSWAIGYAIFIVPGGWGIRELVFMHFLSHDFPESIVFILPILSRFAQILAEIVCGVAFSLVGWIEFHGKKG
jgi:hypothetical protein